MKVMKELQSLSPEQLRHRLVEQEKELLKLRVQVTLGNNAKGPKKMKGTKKNIARILMLLGKKEVL